jgi:hypothetical protein
MRCASCAIPRPSRGSGAEQRRRERAEGGDVFVGARRADYLHADVVGARREVRTHTIDDRVGLERERRIQQPIRSPAGDVGLVEAEPPPVVRIVRELR